MKLCSLAPSFETVTSGATGLVRTQFQCWPGYLEHRLFEDVVGGMCAFVENGGPDHVYATMRT